MGKMVGFVFKTIILTILLITTVTVATSVIDIFISYSRVNSITEYIEFDIAQNNCMLNDTYMSYVGKSSTGDDSDNDSLLASVAKRSNCWSWRTEGTESGHVVNLFVGDTQNDYFIQKDADTQPNGVLYSEKIQGNSAPGTNEFYVAQYGEILHLQLNAYAQIHFFSMGAGKRQVSNMSWLNGPAVPLTLKYDIPALTYLK